MPQALQIAVGDIGGIIRLARFHRDGGGGRIGDEPCHETIEVGKIGLPVVRVLPELHIATAFPFLEDEGAGANGRVAVRALIVVFRSIGMGRQNGRFATSQRPQKIGRGFGKHHHRRQRIGRFDIGNIGEGNAPARPDLLEGKQGEFHILRGEILAIMPFDALAQLEGVAQPVGGGFPAFGQNRMRLELAVEAHQPFEDFGGNGARARVGIRKRHQCRRLAEARKGDNAALFRGFRRQYRQGWQQHGPG